MANPVRAGLQSSPPWLILFLVVAAVGAVAQYETTRHWEVATFNRLAGWSDSDVAAPGRSRTTGAGGYTPAHDGDAR